MITYCFYITRLHPNRREQWHLYNIHIQNSYKRVIMYLVTQSYFSISGTLFLLEL